jgi:hypothetical protein
MVGYALPKQATPSLSYAGMSTISDVFQVSKCQGNIIMEFTNGKNPAQILMDLTRQDSPERQRDNIYYLLLEQEGKSMAKQILSGDPSKGHLALNHFTEPLATGQMVRFARKTMANESIGQSPLNAPESHRVVFGNLSTSIPELTESRTLGSSLMGVSSETGVIFSHPAAGNKLTTSVEDATGAWFSF